jgi:hypothetical protein
LAIENASLQSRPTFKDEERDVALIEENQRSQVIAPPSLLGSTGSAAPKTETLKILSALRSPAAAPWSHARGSFVIAFAAFTIAGAGVWGWSSKGISGEKRFVAGATPVVTSSAEALPAVPAAQATSTAIIENLPAALLPPAPLETTAASSPQSTPPRRAAAQTVPSPAAAMPAKHHARSAPSPRPHSATRTASTRSRKPPVTRKEQEQRAAKEADVALIQAMMAHVRGDGVAAAR